jgi:NAD(P)-dependent dehydrogenase (short-subunit alcohol dehydrogenase family)
VRHVLITGGSDGLGKLAAEMLKSAEFSVTILGQDEAKTKAVAEKLHCKYVIADVAENTQVETAMSRAIEVGGPIDVLINNAGIWLQGALEANDPERIERVIKVNTLGTVYCSRAVVPSMKQRGSGRIINVISQGGLYAKAERSTYTASKWAITGFTKCMQAELKSFNIAVDGFYLGALNNTGLFEKAGNSEGRDMSKALDPAVAADALVYLCKLPDGISAPELGLVSLGY